MATWHQKKEPSSRTNDEEEGCDRSLLQTLLNVYHRAEDVPQIFRHIRDTADEKSSANEG